VASVSFLDRFIFNINLKNNNNNKKKESKKDNCSKPPEFLKKIIIKQIQK